MRVLLVEDDPTTSRSIELMLTHANLNVYCTDMGEEGIDLAKLYDYDLILLDLNLPDMNGHEVLRQLRLARVDTPILILSGEGDTENKLKGFGFGADDYLTKPFDLAELSARLAAVARRYAGNPNPLIELGDLSVDLAARTVTRGGKAVDLTAREWALFEALLRHPGQILSKVQLEDRLYDFDSEIGSNTIEVHVSRLRKKLGPGAVETLRGLGYRLGSGR